MSARLLGARRPPLKWVAAGAEETILRSHSGSLRTLSQDKGSDTIVWFHPLLTHAAHQDANDSKGTLAMTVMTDLFEPHASSAHTGSKLRSYQTSPVLYKL